MGTALLLLTLISVGAGMVLTIVSILPARTKNDDGRITRAGSAFLLLAVASSLSNFATSQIEARRAERERMSADSLAQARTDSIVRRLEHLTRRAEAIEGESERLHELQQLSLQQVRSLSDASRMLAGQQQRAIHDLDLSLAIAQRISDSLQASVTLSREIADSLRLAETRADQRTQQTLAIVERSRNPLTSLRSEFYIDLHRTDRATGAILDELFRAYRRARGSNSRFFGENLVVGDVWFPRGIAIAFFKPGDSDGSRTLAYVFRSLNYDSVTVRFVSPHANGPITSMRLSWRERDFELLTTRNITVDDLDGACVHLSFNQSPMFYRGQLPLRIWVEADVGMGEITFPQGRRGDVGLEVRHNPVVAWLGKLLLDYEHRNYSPSAARFREHDC